MEKVTVSTLLEKKLSKKKIIALTAYDYAFAKIIDECGVDIILVGDSLANVMLGYETTLPVTMEEMIHHTKAVVRAVKNAMVVFDMPFLSYQVSAPEAVRNAGRALKETGCHAVKLEGGSEISEIISSIIKAGIPVMGHLGLTPQSIHVLGGYKVQGKEKKSASKLKDDCLLLEELGVFSIVFECIPWKLTKLLAEELKIPVIGIGAGPYCDGQILVMHDMLGLSKRKMPKFVKKYAELWSISNVAIKNYIEDINSGAFPTKENSYEIDDEILSSL